MAKKAASKSAQGDTSTPENPFVGSWRIVSMSQWDKDYIDAEVPGYIRFDKDGGGEFQFGYVAGSMSCKLMTKDDQLIIKWKWEGNDEMDEAFGTGWAKRKGNKLSGKFLFDDEGEESTFNADLITSSS